METNDRFHTEQQAEPHSKKSKHAKHVHSVWPRHEETAVREVTIYLEQEGKNKFKIQTDQLEQIGAQLRGRRKFSIFQSIILPLIVGGSIFTYFFQYISWSNQVAVQKATEVATKAAHTYENVAGMLHTRLYATLVFLPSLRDMAEDKAKRNIVTSIEQQNTKKRSTQSSTASASTSAASTEESLHNHVLDIKKQRFAHYYEQLKLWNENYDRLVSDIEITFDQPVFRQAGVFEVFPLLRSWLSQINCSNSLTEELQRLKLNPNSLKFGFAALHWCFIQTNGELDGLLTEAIASTAPSFNRAKEFKIRDNLDALHSNINVFRCYALSRLDYYDSERYLSVLNVLSALWKNTEAERARKHFEDTANRCKS
jgi:hypothetical protein